MSGGFREFIAAVESAARTARSALMEQTIESYAPRAAERVEALRQQNPDWSRETLADHLIREAASYAASVGAAVATPGVIVGPGTAVSVALAGPEIVWLFREQVRLFLEIAAVYDRDPADRAARMPEMEGLFRSAFAAVHSGNTGTQFLLTALWRGGRRRPRFLFPAVGFAVLFAGLALRRGRFFRRLPLLGIPIGAAFNAMAIASAGVEAKNRYAQPVATVTEASADEEGIEDSPAGGDEPPPSSRRRRPSGA